jgi:hypothetical protein
MMSEQKENILRMSKKLDAHVEHVRRLERRIHDLRDRLAKYEDAEGRPVVSADLPDTIALAWQGRVDGTNEGFRVNGMLAVPAEEGVTYVTREQAIEFFGLNSSPVSTGGLDGRADPIVGVLKTCLAEGVQPTFSGGDLKHLIKLLEDCSALSAPSYDEQIRVPDGEPDWPEYHHSGMGCGLEDRGITDRYEAMQHGWDDAFERCVIAFNDWLAATPSAASQEQGE